MRVCSTQYKIEDKTVKNKIQKYELMYLNLLCEVFYQQKYACWIPLIITENCVLHNSSTAKYYKIFYEIIIKILVKVTIYYLKLNFLLLNDVKSFRGVNIKKSLLNIYICIGKAEILNKNSKNILWLLSLFILRKIYFIVFF